MFFVGFVFIFCFFVFRVVFFFSVLLVDNFTFFGNVKEVIVIKDYCLINFIILKFFKGDYFYVLDTSGGEWWYVYNIIEMGYIFFFYV